MSVLEFNNICLLILILHWDKKKSAEDWYLPIHLGYGDGLILLNANDKNIFRCGAM